MRRQPDDLGSGDTWTNAHGNGHGDGDFAYDTRGGDADYEPNRAPWGDSVTVQGVYEDRWSEE